MENINTIAIKVLKSYKEFSQSGDINELKIWSSFYMREFIRSTEKDEDLASEVYLKLEGKMDHLIRKFYAKSPNKYLSFLKVCAKNIVRNLTKKSIKENQVMDYLVYTHGIENSCHVVDQSRFMKQ
ncbi:MAG: hypothetical protein JJT78_02910, partial [Leptospira sp.]|nr:hypothetical protein [Leptospira sp.]